MIEVWVLDVAGYDARGGMARLYSTKEAAMAATPETKWKQTGPTSYEQAVEPGDISDIWILDLQEVLK